MARHSPKIAVVGIDGGQSTISLLDRVEAATGFRCFVDMGKVVADLDAATLHCGDVDLAQLDAVIVKKVAPEYSPAVLDRLELLIMLRRLGVAVFSEPTRILRLVNRLSNTLELRAAGIPLPPTLVTEDLDEAARTVERWGAVVAKPLFTSKARGMTIFRPGETLLDELAAYQSMNKMLYLQQLLDLPGRDLGVSFVGGRYLATYARVSDGSSWNTTTVSGGHYAAAEPSDEIVALATRAQAVFGLDFTCVDVVETAEGPRVLEVSAFGGFRGLWEACRIDAAERLTQHVIAELGRG